MAIHDVDAVLRPSFRYGGRPSEQIISAWDSDSASEQTARGKLTRNTFSDPTSGLKVTTHALRLDGFAAVDWVAEIENCGTADTPIIEDIVLHCSIPLAVTEHLRLHHANGSSCRMDDFLPLTQDVRPGGGVQFSPHGGRSSNGVLPFFNLQGSGGGLVIGVGWSGQWMLKLDRTDDALHVRCGMERTHLVLHPGERIRTPRVLLLQWQGDDDETGNNALRQLLLAHYLPRLNGELALPPTAQCLQGYYYLTGKAGESIEMKALPKAAAAGAEAYWIDACWYGGTAEWWQEVGTWIVNRDKFPNGIKPISDAAREAGMKFVLWFEPERVRPGSQLHREHPEWLLKAPNDDNLLLDLGNPDAHRHITDLLSSLITENGVDIYRQDFNFNPLGYWQAADAPDRIGMTEIRYIEGFYRLWDELRRRHPNIWIDNCASGGRRIDLETLSRSLPLWPSDFPDVCGLPFGLGLHVGDQCINAGLARWVPLFGGGVWNFTPYGVRGEIMGGFTFGFHIEHEDFPPDGHESVVSHQEVLARGKTALDDDFPLDDVRAAIAEWRSIRPFFLGDFHLLLPLTVSYHDWCAWQLHRDDLQAGIAMFFRRHRSPFPKMEAALKRIDPDAEYNVSISPGWEESHEQRMSGRQLARIAISISEAPGSVLLRYSRVRENA